MTDQKPKGTPVKLTVTSCVVGYQGKNTRGDDFTIYEITACRESGEVITDKKLRSFEELPVGELLDLTVVPFNSTKHGLSFTLSLKNKTGAHQRVNELKDDVQALLRRIEGIERWIAQRSTPPGEQQAPPQQAQAPPPQDDDRQRELDARFGATSPF